MLRLKITPQEFAAMIFFMRQATEGHRQLPLQKQSVNMLVMAQYLAKWNSYRFLLWMSRPDNKTYWMSIPLPVAKSLHQDMPGTYLGEWQQLFLNKLDQAVINYSDPLTQTYVLGDLIHQLSA
ncbi:hypothetical protein GCM10028819_32410 [Spirosoma humi]